MKPPVFIVGYPRSGTTLLLHLLMGSGAFPTYPFTETHFYSHYFRRYGPLARPKNRVRFLTSIQEADWFRKSGCNIAEVVERWNGRGGDSYGGFLGEAMSDLCHRQGKDRWLEKTPWHGKYIPQIRADFPDAKFVHMIRDPRDVALSVAGAGWIVDRRWRRAALGLSWQWQVRLVERYLVGMPGSGLTIRYEDLVGDTAQATAELSDFLGLDLDPHSLVRQAGGVLRKSNTSQTSEGAGPGLSTGSVARWKRSDRSLLEIDWVAGQTMRALGYEPRRCRCSVALAKLLEFLYSGYRRARFTLFPVVRR